MGSTKVMAPTDTTSEIPEDAYVACWVWTGNRKVKCYDTGDRDTCARYAREGGYDGYSQSTESCP